MVLGMSRTYARRTPTLDEALDAAPEAELVPADAPQPERVTAWVDAYRQIAAEDGRSEYLQASVAAAVAAGVL